MLKYAEEMKEMKRKTITGFCLILMTLLMVLETAAQYKAQKPRGKRQTASGIRQVDFRNYTYNSSGDWCRENLVLRKGKARYGDDVMDSAELSSVKYVDFDGDGREEAFVIISWTTSGSAGGGIDTFVFASQNGSAQPIWSKCNERASAALKGRSIFFTYPEYVGDDAHCCPSYITTDTYSWKGAGFTRTSKKRKRTNP